MNLYELTMKKLLVRKSSHFSYWQETNVKQNEILSKIKTLFIAVVFENVLCSTLGQYRVPSVHRLLSICLTTLRVAKTISLMKFYTKVANKVVFFILVFKRFMSKKKKQILTHLSSHPNKRYEKQNRAILIADPYDNLNTLMKCSLPAVTFWSIFVSGRGVTCLLYTSRCV